MKKNGNGGGGNVSSRMPGKAPIRWTNAILATTLATTFATTLATSKICINGFTIRSDILNIFTGQSSSESRKTLWCYSFKIIFLITVKSIGVLLALRHFILQSVYILYFKIGS